MYSLITSTDTKRNYRSSITGSELTTSVIRTDGSGNKWWAFDDLLQIPFIRKKGAEKITQLYGAGITADDLTKFVNSLKGILKGNDGEKYEKAYSEVLQLEAIAGQTVDPIRQSLSLCSVYILADNEQPDTFSFQVATEKMNLWALDMDSQAFFLNWLTDGMNDFTKHLETISQTVLKQERSMEQDIQEPTEL